MDSTTPLPVIVVFSAGLAYSSRKNKNYLHIVNTLKVIYPTPSKILLKSRERTYSRDSIPSSILTDTNKCLSCGDF